MDDDLLRMTIGLPVALLWPRGITFLAVRPVWSALASAATAALVVAAAFPAWQAFALLVLTAVAAAMLADRARAAAAKRREGPVDDAPPAATREGRWAWVWELGLAVALAALAAAIGGFDEARNTLRAGAESDDVTYVVVGALAATFVTGHLVGWVLDPFATRIEGPPAGMLSAGRAVGWLERVLVFAFLLGGEPGAAALALTAKSVARFPAFEVGKEPLAEYVLIGTLLSFALATLTAMGTRALLGMSAF